MGTTDITTARTGSSVRQPESAAWPRHAAYSGGWRSLLMGIGGAFYLLPLFWMATSSLKTNGEVFAYPATVVPGPSPWHNYVEAWHDHALPPLLRNTRLDHVHVHGRRRARLHRWSPSASPGCASPGATSCSSPAGDDDAARLR